MNISVQHRRYGRVAIKLYLKKFWTYMQEMAHPSCIRGDTVLLKCSETKNNVVSVAIYDVR